MRHRRATGSVLHWSRSAVCLLLMLLLTPTPHHTDAAVAQFFSASSSAAARGDGGTSAMLDRPADPCYDDDRTDPQPQRCLPDFVNAAFSRAVVASSTCGLSTASRYCVTSRHRDGRVGRSCHVCDDTEPRLRHPPTYLTDLNNPSNLTCWISAPLEDQRDDQRSDNVTLTLSLGKKFEVRQTVTALGTGARTTHSPTHSLTANLRPLIDAVIANSPCQ